MTRSLVLAAALSGGLAGMVAAQAPDAPPRLTTQVDLSFVQAAGNTRLRTLHVAEQLVYHPAPWKLTQTFAVVNGESDGSETANSLKAGLRADYEFTPRFRLYALTGFERDRFAGLARRWREEAGVSYGVLATAGDTLDAEAGMGLTQEKGDTTAARDYAAARLAGRYRHAFRENTFFEARAELLSNLADGNDNRVNGDLALIAPVSRNIAIKLGYTVRYDQQPEPAKRTTDTIASAGLQIVF